MPMRGLLALVIVAEMGFSQYRLVGRSSAEEIGFDHLQEIQSQFGPGYLEALAFLKICLDLGFPLQVL